MARPSRRRPRPGTRPRLVAIATLTIGVGVCAGAPDARAYEAMVDTSFTAQLYQTPSPFGDPVLQRRRYTQTLSLRVLDLEGQHRPGGPTLSAVARLRLDSDFGVSPGERDPFRQERFVPGLTEQPLDVMYAYVEGRGYAGGALGFRLGRQLLSDPIGWWAFDGALVRLTTPAHLDLEAYGGFEQRGGAYLLGTPRYEADGVLRGNRTGYSSNLWPSYLSESRLAPAYGFSAAATSVSWLDARASYRKVIQRDTVASAPFADPVGGFPAVTGARTSSERVGAVLAARADGVGSVGGGAVYDLLSRRVSSVDLNAEWLAATVFRLGAEAGYFLPLFDGDSIFTWFTRYGTSTLRGRAAWDVTRRVSVSATGGVRRFDAEDRGSLLDVLGSVEGVYRSPAETATLRLSDEHGQRGANAGADASVRRAFAGGLYDASALAALQRFRDSLRPDRGATSVTYVLGGGFRPFPRARLGVEWEHTMNRLAGQRFRALCTLDLTVL